MIDDAPLPVEIVDDEWASHSIAIVPINESFGRLNVSAITFASSTAYPANMFDALVSRTPFTDAGRPAESPPAAEVAERFNELAASWKRETAGSAFVTAKAMNWAYQQIIGMGSAVLPLILSRLESATDHWFWALAAITGEDPATGIDTMSGAAQAWLSWGRQRGLV